MNDRYDAYYGGDQSYELVGYDEYGQPVYRPAPAQQVPQQQAYDPYGTQQPQEYGQGYGYGYDPYATGQVQQQHPQGYGTDYDSGQQAPAPAYDPYDPYGQTAATGPQASVAEQTAYIPQQLQDRRRPPSRESPGPVTPSRSGTRPNGTPANGTPANGTSAPSSSPSSRSPTATPRMSSTG